MPKIIRYVLGFPLKQEPVETDFGKFRTRYKLKTELEHVSYYSGPLTFADFSGIDFVLTSAEYLSLDSWTDRDKKKILFLAKNNQLSDEYNPSSKPLDKVSKHFIPMLKKLFEMGDLSASDANEYLQKKAKKDGAINPVSFSYPISDGYKYVDISSKVKALVFINDTLCGKVWLEGLELINDQWAGPTDFGKMVAEVGRKTKKFDWTSWNSNSIRYSVDCWIRKKILKENLDKGVWFREL